MSLDALFHQAEADGLYLNNLFQTHDGQWWAEWRLQQAEGHYGFASAKARTPLHALQLAWANIISGDTKPSWEEHQRQTEKAAAQQAIQNLSITDAELDELLGERKQEIS